MINFDESTESLLDSKPYHNTITCAKVLFSGKYGYRKFLAALVHLGVIDRRYLPIGRLNDKSLVKYWRKTIVKPNGKKFVRYTIHFSKAGVEYLHTLINTYRNFPWFLNFKCIELLKLSIYEMDLLKPGEEKSTIELG